MADRSAAEPPTLTSVDDIDRALPQTQCTRCGYPDCRSYAQAIFEGSAAINRCPPGGAEGIARLAAIVGTAVQPLDVSHGVEGPRRLAVIDEATCIGCTLCLPACPVDSILGGPKAMHTVMASLCTGCELCIPACPVDCISLIDVTGEQTGWAAWSPQRADEAKARYGFHKFRLQRDRSERHARLEARALALKPLAVGPSPEADSVTPQADPAPATDTKRAVIDAALARARANRRT